MNILSSIKERKLQEVEIRKRLITMDSLEKRPLFGREPVSLVKSLQIAGSTGIIAEFKRKSPSVGWINRDARAEIVTPGYIRSGAAALSVLTDTDFFGGHDEDLLKARELNRCPILRKEFILDPYQVIESKSLGADVILLIAAILSASEATELARLARSLGMETILEVHAARDLALRNEFISIIGVNNRNLDDFSVNLDTSFQLSVLAGPGTPLISESGIKDPADILPLKQAGFQGFLIGGIFMATQDPAGACRQFISGIEEIDP